MRKRNLKRRDLSFAEAEWVASEVERLFHKTGIEIFVDPEYDPFECQCQATFYLADYDGQDVEWESAEITYSSGTILLHEIGHALVNAHVGSKIDARMSVLKQEVAAWSAAEYLAEYFGFELDYEEIVAGLESHIDWASEEFGQKYVDKVVWGD